MQAKIWYNAVWIKETDPEKLRTKFDALLREAGFNILCFVDHHFEPQWYTALWLLTESHFAIHTFPEFGKSYIEIASCNLEYYQNFLKLTKEV